MPVGKKKRPKKFSGNSVNKRSPLWTYIHIRALYRYNAENKSNNSSLHLANRPVRPDLHLLRPKWSPRPVQVATGCVNFCHACSSAASKAATSEGPPTGQVVRA